MSIPGLPPSVIARPCVVLPDAASSDEVSVSATTRPSGALVSSVAVAFAGASDHAHAALVGG